MKEQKFISIAFIMLLIIVLVIVFWFASVREIDMVCFQKSCFHVELADTQAERELGLSNRATFSEDTGMLFIFEQEGQYGFWMKDTLIPLDIIWIDKDKQVVFIQKNAEPCKQEPCQTYNPRKNALYVLELNSGMSDKIGLKEGDKLKF